MINYQIIVVYVALGLGLLIAWLSFLMQNWLMFVLGLITIPATIILEMNRNKR